MANAHLKTVEQRLLWLSHWMIHHANHIRPNPDGIKVGGHQASSASMVSIMTALYFSALRPEDRVAVKPHARPCSTRSSISWASRPAKSSRRSGALAARRAIPPAPRTWTTSISRRGPWGLASGSRRWRPSFRTSSRRRHGRARCRWGGWWRSPATRRWTRATSTRCFRRAGRTTCETRGGSSTTTASRSTGSYARACSDGSRRSSRPSAGMSW
jgi:hypothetical protein